MFPLAPTLDHVGPMARTVADCSALLTALAEDGAEPTAHMPPPQPLGTLPTSARPGPKPLAGLTIALTDRPANAESEPRVMAGPRQRAAGLRVDSALGWSSSMRRSCSTGTT